MHSGWKLAFLGLYAQNSGVRLLECLQHFNWSRRDRALSDRLDQKTAGLSPRVRERTFEACRDFTACLVGNQCDALAAAYSEAGGDGIVRAGEQTGGDGTKDHRH